MEESGFTQLDLAPQILEALESLEYKNPSPIQEKAIPTILEGRDLFACAQTGTGKTAAYLLPILDALSRDPDRVRPMQFKALILVPTRELAEQVSQSIEKYAKHLNISSRKVYGGVSAKPQIRALEKGVDILVATPGRLIDLFNQGKFNFAGVKHYILDEADRMLDMGFLPDIKRITYKLPRDHRQSLLFSATLSKEIRELASFIVDDPAWIEISPKSPVVDKIDQSVCFLDRDKKYELLKMVLEDQLGKDGNNLALVFAKTKRTASNLAKKLNKEGFTANAIHGDKTQAHRQRALESFRARQTRVLVATDIAARGIDVSDMSLVINYEMPIESENYVHRIGRTARANMDGKAISFCAQDELYLLQCVEKYIKREIDIDFDNNPFHNEKIFHSKQKKQSRPKNLRGGGGPAPKHRGGKKDFGEKRDSRGNYKRGSRKGKEGKDAGRARKGKNFGRKPRGDSKEG